MRTKLIKLPRALLILSLPFLASCQDGSSFDFGMGGFYTYRILRSKEPVVAAALEGTQADKAVFNWNTGIYYQRQVAGNTFFRLGIQLMSMGYTTTRHTGLQWGDQVGPDFQYLPIPTRDPAAEQFRRRHDFIFIGIPLLLRHQFGSQKLTPYIEYGAIPSIYLATRSKQVGSGQELIKYKHVIENKFQAVGNVSIGLIYTINTRLQLYGQPAFRYHFTKSDDTIIREHLYGFGLEVGIRNTFK